MPWTLIFDSFPNDKVLFYEQEMKLLPEETTFPFGALM